MRAKKKGEYPSRPDANSQPKESMLILAEAKARRNGDLAIVKEKGGSGSDWRLTPDPRTATDLNQKSRVVA